MQDYKAYSSYDLDHLRFHDRHTDKDRQLPVSIVKFTVKKIIIIRPATKKALKYM